MIMPDLQPFVSPIDGKEVSGRAALREHDKRHGVTNVADYKETWAKAEAERAKFYNAGGYDRQNRIERIKEAIERNRR